MRLVPILTLAIMMLAVPVSAADPVEVTADNMVVVEADSQAVFTGNVVVTHPDVVVKAPKVVVEYGSGGATDIKSFEATGGVVLTTDEQTATGDVAVFDPATRILTLTGNVEVDTGGSKVKGPSLTINLANNTSTFTGGSSGRVTGVFSAQ